MNVFCVLGALSRNTYISISFELYMCMASRPIHTAEYEKALAAVPGTVIVLWEDPRERRTGYVSATGARKYLILTFVLLSLAFYAFFKLVVFSVAELKGAIFVFVFSFAVGFLTAATRQRN